MITIMIKVIIVIIIIIIIITIIIMIIGGIMLIKTIIIKIFKKCRTKLQVEYKTE